jgi:putative transposase
MSESSTPFRVFKYRLYPSHVQERNLFRVLNGARHLYNMALAERRYAWEFERRAVTLKELDTLARHYRNTMPYGQQIYSQTAQSVVHQLDLAFAAFFRRVQSGQTPGYPRFKQNTQFNSVMFPQPEKGAMIDGRRLKLFGIGRVAVRWHRPMEGKVKTVRILHRAGEWFALFTNTVETPKALKKSGKAIGIDVGISALITTSSGDKVEHPHYYRSAQKRLRVLQRSVQRKRMGGRNRRKALLKVQAQHAHIRNQRRDFAHKLSFTLVKHFDVIGVEDLQIANMVRNKHLSKSILDAGWAVFTGLLTSKAESAGREVMFVNPRNTSKTCSRCGFIFEHLTLKDRWIECSCGLSLDRDHNAAVNILKRTGWDASAGVNVERIEAHALSGSPRL